LIAQNNAAKYGVSKNPTAQHLPIIPAPQTVVQFPNAPFFNWPDQIEVQLIGTDTLLKAYKNDMIARLYDALPQYTEDALIPRKPYYTFVKNSVGEIAETTTPLEASATDIESRRITTYHLTINPELLPIRKVYLEQKNKGPFSWLHKHSPIKHRIKLVLHQPYPEKIAKTDPNVNYYGTWKTNDYFINFIPHTLTHRESYVLKIGSGKQPTIEIHAIDFAGMCWGLSSLRQLTEQSKTGSLLPMQIEDYPKFPYRGMHLDVSRHFFSAAEIKRYIDHLSFYKINTFHWHLCDDQGWRIEIKKYPKLTDVGAWRMNRDDQHWRSAQPQEAGETPNYGGYYTQEEIKEIVSYAKARGVSIVPEIEMPGHSSAALAAYPNLSCSKMPQFVVPGGNYPKTNSSVFCAGNDATFAFLEDILDEVMSLFPESQYIHIGGDEVDKSAWKNCLMCQQRIKVLKEVSSSMGASNDINDWSHPEERLQSYFIARMEKYLNAHGRNIIGWDEILEGGLAPNAAVMSWRGVKGGIEAAQMKHPVVMTPGFPCYFDHYQGEPSSEPLAFGGMNTLKDVYYFRPIPNELKPEFQPYVVGAQANVWTEFMKDFKQVEYMILPRMLALSEALWTGSSSKNAYKVGENAVEMGNRNIDTAFEDFLDRVVLHESFGNFAKVKFAHSQYGIKPKIETGHDTIWVEMSSASGYAPRGFNGKPDQIAIQKSRAGMSWEELPTHTDIENPLAKSKGGGVPVSEWTQIEKLYHGKSGPKVAVTESSDIHGYFSQNINQSVSLSFRKHLGFGKSIQLSTPPDSRYPGHGEGTLCDGLVGGNYLGAHWLGFYGKDVVAVMDLDTITDIQSITLGALSLEPSWIFAPTEVQFETSMDKKTWELHPMPMQQRVSVSSDTVMFSAGKSMVNRTTQLGNKRFTFDEIWGRSLADNHIHFTVNLQPNQIPDAPAFQARFIRITAKCRMSLPPNHPGVGNPAWIFIDEIVVK
jgi:hexosaminidase